MQMTPAAFLVKGLELGPLDKPKLYTGLDTFCAISGQFISSGFRKKDIIPKTTAEYHDLLIARSDYVSEAVGIAWKGSWNLGSRLIFEDGTHYHPLIDPKAARKQKRPCWRDVAREVYPSRSDQQVLILLSTDFKKRIWPYARVGILGQATSVYHLDSDLNIDGVAMIDWQKMIAYLDRVEDLITKGFNRYSVLETLLKDKTGRKIGLSQSAQWERELQAIRNTPEFKIAWTIGRGK